jgi:hypothetical protein
MARSGAHTLRHVTLGTANRPAPTATEHGNSAGSEAGRTIPMPSGATTCACREAKAVALRTHAANDAGRPGVFSLPSHLPIACDSGSGWGLYPIEQAAAVWLRTPFGRRKQGPGLLEAPNEGVQRAERRVRYLRELWSTVHSSRFAGQRMADATELPRNADVRYGGMKVLFRAAVGAQDHPGGTPVIVGPRVWIPGGVGGRSVRRAQLPPQPHQQSIRAGRMPECRAGSGSCSLCSPSSA